MRATETRQQWRVIVVSATVTDFLIVFASGMVIVTAKEKEMVTDDVVVVAVVVDDVVVIVELKMYLYMQMLLTPHWNLLYAGAVYLKSQCK